MVTQSKGWRKKREEVGLDAALPGRSGSRMLFMKGLFRRKCGRLDRWLLELVDTAGGGRQGVDGRFGR